MLDISSESAREHKGEAAFPPHDTNLTRSESPFRKFAPDLAIKALTQVDLKQNIESFLPMPQNWGAVASINRTTSQTSRTPGVYYKIFGLDPLKNTSRINEIIGLTKDYTALEAVYRVLVALQRRDAPSNSIKELFSFLSNGQLTSGLVNLCKDTKYGALAELIYRVPFLCQFLPAGERQLTRNWRKNIAFVVGGLPLSLITSTLLSPFLLLTGIVTGVAVWIQSLNDFFSDMQQKIANLPYCRPIATQLAFVLCLLLPVILPIAFIIADFCARINNTYHLGNKNGLFRKSGLNLNLFLVNSIFASAPPPTVADIASGVADSEKITLIKHTTPAPQRRVQSPSSSRELSSSASTAFTPLLRSDTALPQGKITKIF
ncbi:hypothetical protein BH10PSE19_BH10PSE19_21410 [soil metagenome]